MNRRKLIKIISATSLLPFMSKIGHGLNVKNEPNTGYEIIKPNKLKLGDKIGIIAPASNASTPEEIYKATETAKYFGLVPVFGENLMSGDGYKTRSVQGRIDDLHSMFVNKNINAIMCIRGGYGSSSLLDKIDYDLIKKNPKIFIGYSDITALHIAIHQITGLITFHGPVMLSSFSDYTINYFRKALFDLRPIGLINNPGSTKIRNNNPIHTISSGIAEGKLVGGNLSLISSLMGTKYELNCNNKILFLEDVGEKPYSLHRMLTQLKQSGKLDNANGVIIGKCDDCQPSGSQNSLWDYSELEAYEDIFKDYSKPVFSGMLIGHTKEQLTLPIGVEIRIDADKGSLDILESGLS